MDDDIQRKLREILNSVTTLQLVNIIAAIIRPSSQNPAASTGISPTIYIACAAAAGAVVLIAALLVIKYKRN